MPKTRAKSKFPVDGLRVSLTLQIGGYIRECSETVSIEQLRALVEPRERVKEVSGSLYGKLVAAQLQSTLFRGREQ
jgi:hypothetical protein